MPEAYSKSCQISTMISHIEYPGIIRTVFSGIFSNIQHYSAMFRHIEEYYSILMYIQALLRHIQPYSTLHNPCIYNCAIFKTLTHLEPKASSMPVEHVRLSSVFRAPGIFRLNSSILKDI